MPVELLEAPPAPAEPKRWFDAYTGNRIPVATRMKIMDGLAMQVPAARIAEDCGVSRAVVKAIEFSQSDTIESRKSHLMDQAFRIAGKAYDRVEDTIDNAPLAQASVVAGIFSEKALLLAGEPTQRIEVNITTADDLYSKMDQLKAKLEEHPTLEAEFTKLPDTSTD